MSDQWTAPDHEHSHSVFVRCKDCLIFGTPRKGEYQCGNCQSHNTISYNPPCCVEEQLRLADELAEDCRRGIGGGTRAEYSEWRKSMIDSLNAYKKSRGGQV